MRGEEEVGGGGQVGTKIHGSRQALKTRRAGDRPREIRSRPVVQKSQSLRVLCLTDGDNKAYLRVAFLLPVGDPGLRAGEKRKSMENGSSGVDGKKGQLDLDNDTVATRQI